MVKKRSCFLNSSQPTGKMRCKKIKLNGENEPITERKVENDEETSGPLTAAETVGRNTDLMRLIVRNLDSVSDRKNIAESCKALNILCDSKESYVESYKHRIFRKCEIDFPRDKPLFIVFGEVLVINISRYCRSVTKNLKMIRSKIWMNRHKIKALKIRNLPVEYFNYFKGLDCFENVKTVYFDTLKSQYIPLKIFSEWASLKPDTLIFGNAEVYHSDYNDSNRAVYSDGNYTFPKSVKHVHLVCMTEDVDWMVNALENFDHYELESLVLGENFNECLTSDSMESIVSVVRYFKKIQFSLRYTGFVHLNQYFLQTLGDFVLIENADITIDIHFDVPKCDINVWASSNPPTMEDNTLSYNLYENVSVDERYMHMKSFKIIRQDYRLHMMPLERSEMRLILRGLSKMQNLQTLELDFDVMPDRFNFSKLFRVLNKCLKNVKFSQCLTELRYDDLETLSNKCPNIGNMSLDSITRHNITIKKITSLFKNLKGLEIEFTPCYSTMNVINDLTKEDEINGNYLLDWPNLNFLSVYFKPPEETEEELLDAIDRNTPKKPGQFLIRRDFYFSCKYVWQIIIQKNTSYASTFNDVLHSSYIF